MQTSAAKDEEKINSVAAVAAPLPPVQPVPTATLVDERCYRLARHFLGRDADGPKVAALATGFQTLAEAAVAPPIRIDADVPNIYVQIVNETERKAVRFGFTDAEAANDFKTTLNDTFAGYGVEAVIAMFEDGAVCCRDKSKDPSGFYPSDYAHTAKLLRSSEPIRAATASNNHNIILAALDHCAKAAEQS